MGNNYQIIQNEYIRFIEEGVVTYVQINAIESITIRKFSRPIYGFGDGQWDNNGYSNYYNIEIQFINLSSRGEIHINADTMDEAKQYVDNLISDIRNAKNGNATEAF